MHLLMFDLDGTLMKSNTLDVHCFTQAIKSATGIQSIQGDWSHYKHVTDKGIVSEILAEAFGRPATGGELMAVRAKIRQILQDEVTANPWRFAPIPGAVEFLTTLKNLPACGLAIATGSWKEMAILKLSAAGFELGNLPLASSDDSHRREEIMQAAFDRALAFYGVTAFETVTYVGDGAWDLRAAKNLGYHFIGIGFNHNREQMLAQGAAHVFTDFRNQEKMIAEMNRIWSA